MKFMLNVLKKSAASLLKCSHISSTCKSSASLDRCWIVHRGVFSLAAEVHSHFHDLRKRDTFSVGSADRVSDEGLSEVGYKTEALSECVVGLYTQMQDADEGFAPQQDDSLVIQQNPKNNNIGSDHESERIAIALHKCKGVNKQTWDALDSCGVSPSPKLVRKMLRRRLKHDWKPAFALFLWAASQPHYGNHTRHAYLSMIDILGKARQFSLAWGVIKEIHARGLLDSSHPLVIMMMCYSAAKQPALAVQTFQHFEKFGLRADISSFRALLIALCRFGYVYDAEKLLLLNKDIYGCGTRDFNIVLHGYCSSVVEVKRFSVVMARNNVFPDASSYTSLITCLTRAREFGVVAELFHEMKTLVPEPDATVYNSFIFALVRQGDFTEAWRVLNEMVSTGLSPTTVTYNSFISSLCRAQHIGAAYNILAKMIHSQCSPTDRTFHYFLRLSNTPQEALNAFNMMRDYGCCPSVDSYSLLIRKLCEMHDLDNVYFFWNDMKLRGLYPNRSTYLTLIHGLFFHSRIKEAFGYYEEMKRNGLSPDPTLDWLFNNWFAGKQAAASPQSKCTAFSSQRRKKRVKSEKSGRNPDGTYGTGHRMRSGPFFREQFIERRGW